MEKRRRMLGKYGLIPASGRKHETKWMRDKRAQAASKKAGAARVLGVEKPEPTHTGAPLAPHAIEHPLTAMRRQERAAEEVEKERRRIFMEGVRAMAQRSKKPNGSSA